MGTGRVGRCGSDLNEKWEEGVGVHLPVILRALSAGDEGLNCLPRLKAPTGSNWKE